MEHNQQEIIFKLSMFEQQMQQLQQQIQAVEQSVVELQSLSEGLNEFKDSENAKNSQENFGATKSGKQDFVGKEIMAQIGRGIFIKSKIISKDLLVDVGERNFVKKTIPETQELINEQVVKLKEARISLNNSIEEVSREAEKLVGEIRGEGD